MYAAHLYDAVLLYANALRESVAQLTDPVAILEAAKDGRALFKKIIDRDHYTSTHHYTV